MNAHEPGSIIYLNGASSAGKTTLARGLQAHLTLPFWHYSIDHYRDSGILPMERIRSGEFPWPGLRGAFFEGFHASIPALAAAGNHLILEHIVENADWLRRVVGLLRGFDVFFVAVHCPLGELEARERRRGDRPIGDARADFHAVHEHCVYDVEVDSTADLADNVHQVVAAWQRRSAPSGFERMVAAQGGENFTGTTSC